MLSTTREIESTYMKNQVVDVRPGDTVRVHQKIKEGSKERVQIFEGTVIKTARINSLTSTILVRRIASGVGVEKSFLLHSPNVLKVEVTKRSKVRRRYLSYIRNRTGKSTRLTGMDFDKKAVNDIHDKDAEAAEAKLQEEVAAEHEEKEAAEAKKSAEEEQKHAAEFAAHEEQQKSK